MRKIVVAFDHAGVELRKVVVDTVRNCGCEVIDVGTDTSASVDFPDHAYAGCQIILSGEADKGIFVCGSGVGMCLAANKVPGIYAAVCHDVYSAHQAVEHDDLNVLCLGSRVIGAELARELIEAYLGAKFNNKENQIRRMAKVRAIENGTYQPMKNSVKLFKKGVSVWLDNIQRGELQNGKIAALISDSTIRGMTTNPSIFKKSIVASSDYDNALIPLALSGKEAAEIYSTLTIEDIRDAADLFRDLYVSSDGTDGFVSIEVNPTLAHDCEKTIEDGKALWKAVNRPNLMIKVPATEEGIPAITELIASGINVNATLIFSPERYIDVAEAYLIGLQQRIDKGLSIQNIRSVASVFVSRVDTKVDKILKEKECGDESLYRMTGVRNAQKIYNIYLSMFEGEQFAGIKDLGGSAQRVLWASTGVKDPQLTEPFYVEALVGANTVNTVPEKTLKALAEPVFIKQTLPVSDEEVAAYFAKLSEVGVDMNSVYTDLENEGIQAFVKDYTAVIEEIGNRSQAIRSDAQGIAEDVAKCTEEFEKNSIMPRIFAKDPTVWTFNTQGFAEIRNRLGWLDTFNNTLNNVADYAALHDELKAEGIERILLLGMGGSSLAPEVISTVFGANTDPLIGVGDTKNPYSGNRFTDLTDLKLQILDSTDPVQVRESREVNDPRKTVYIVSSKSGGTAEVKAFLDYYYGQAQELLGANAGSHFIAITDPGTGLEKTAKDLNFRKVFLADSSVGGRFSALTAFGMVPAVLMGLDAKKIAAKVGRIMKICSASTPVTRNEGAGLGIFIGAAAKAGRDKLTIFTDPEFATLGSWLEQLIAESSGKEGKGIVPIDLEPSSLMDDVEYGSDRCFVYVNSCGSRAAEIEKIRQQGHPVYEIAIKDQYDLFAEFYRWEIAVAVACSILGVNAFDQPNVQDSKTRTVAKINEYHEKGELADLAPIWKTDGAEVYGVNTDADFSKCGSLEEVLNTFAKTAQNGVDYIAINAYLPRDAATVTSLQKLRAGISMASGCATTLGFGPRFQHSTGQLHKGGANHGLFIQIVSDSNEDYVIPNEDMTFGVLERAQSLGDLESLTVNGRRVIRIKYTKSC